MAPIRVGISGLSIKPSAWATLAHWPYLKSSDHYKVVAVCNSSLETSEAAIKHYGLDGAKAHGSLESMATDPNVDLLVVSTRVDTHQAVATPAIKSGKMVYSEWPLGANVAQAKEMAELAKQHNTRTIVGLQGRVSPAALLVKSIVDSGKLGDIHSVSYYGTTNVWQDNAGSDRYDYFLDRKVGGNLLTIYGGHILDTVLFTVGELDMQSCNVMSGNFRKTMKIRSVVDGKTAYSDKDYPKTTPDQMMLQGRLKRDPPAMFSFHLRAGDKFGDQPGSQWKIYGSKAELQMMFTSAGPQIGPPTSIVIYHFESKQTENVKLDEGGSRWEDLPTQGQNIGRLYEAFANEETGTYADWDHAVRRHELVDSFYNNMV